MILLHRRLVILSLVAALIAGTAIASRRVARLSPTSHVSPDLLLEKARHANKLSAVTSRIQSPLDPQTPTDSGKSSRRQFTVYRNNLGEVVCREATPQEIIERQKADSETPGLRQINHFELDKSVGGQAPEATNLVIVLRATQQLQQNAAATAAFNRAAQNWESLIMSPVTIYIDVDYGTTNFGQAWPTGVLGSTSAPGSSYPYESVRANLIAEATGEGNATKQAIFNALPSTTVPTDLGDASATDVSDSTARAIGLLPATAQPTDSASRIAFNSNFTFDFDPSDGITASAIDFDAVATHEIGHALGFDSDAGLNVSRPSVWDLYRFRTGTTSATFPTAQRIMTIGGAPDPLQYDFIPGNTEIGLSTGGPAGSSANNGDGWQSSHWKHVANCVGAIGIMDPAIPNGCRRTITSSDTLALTSFGYNLTNSNPPPPPPPAPTPPANDNFANAQTISGCSGSVSGSSFGATSEAAEPSHDPTDTSSLSPTHTVWYQWQAPSTGSTTITTSGSDFDTILAVYTGNSVGSLTRLVFNDDVQNGVITTSTVTFPATAGTTYRIVVDGWGGDAGTIKLNWNGCGAPSPTPTPTPTPTPSPTPTPTPGPCPSVLIVNDVGDDGDDRPGDGVCRTPGGVCTLRAAVEEANSRSSCGAISINAPQLPGPITLTRVLPSIVHSLSVNGPNVGQLTVQRSSAAGTQDFRIFAIDPGAAVSISNLRLTNGSFQGGGVYNLGTVGIINSVITGNSSINGSVGGGIMSSLGTLTVRDSVVTSNNAPGGGAGIYIASGNALIIRTTVSGNTGGTNGGGVYVNGGASPGVVTIDSSTVSNNTGGGVVNGGGTLTITNSTISGNSAAGISIGSGTLVMTNSTVNGNTAPSGAGLTNLGTATLINTTVSGNTATSGFGGGIYNRTTLNLTNCTITANKDSTAGGGIYNETSGANPTTNFGNTIVANNIVTNGSLPDLYGSRFFSQDYNLIGVPEGVTGTTTHNLTNVNPLLGPLMNNGGPTMTHALLVGSPAINAGSNALAVDQNNNSLTTDQRGPGFPRIFNGTVDIGAYEAQFTNPIDEATFFVKQQYLDFLNRQPDQSGSDFWTNQITQCGSNASCVEAMRINVSAAFFLSIEFQQTGNLVYKMYKAGFGNLTGKPVAVDRAPFIADTRLIQSTPAQIIVGQGDWQTQLETNKQAFALAFVQRPAFQTAHASQDAATYVSSLFANAGVTPTGTETSAAVSAFNSAGGGDAGRASALRSVAESNSVSNRLFNEAFVLMQYFGYLQRNPYDPPEPTLDYQGYSFWLNKLNQFNGNYINAEMVKAFLASSEYRQRFGP